MGFEKKTRALVKTFLVTKKRGIGMLGSYMNNMIKFEKGNAIKHWTAVTAVDGKDASPLGSPNSYTITPESKIRVIDEGLKFEIYVQSPGIFGPSMEWIRFKAMDEDSQTEIVEVFTVKTQLEIAQTVAPGPTAWIDDPNFVVIEGVYYQHLGCAVSKGCPADIDEKEIVQANS